MPEASSHCCISSTEAGTQSLAHVMKVLSLKPTPQPPALPALRFDHMKLHSGEDRLELKRPGEEGWLLISVN